MQKKKKMGHQAHLGENGLFFLFDGSWVFAGHLVALLNMCATFSHLRMLLCAEQHVQGNTRESP